MRCCEQVARRASTQCGMPVPTLVHFEQQIDAELLSQADDHQDDAAAVTAASTTTQAADWHRGVADGQEDGAQHESTAAAGKARRRPAVEVDWTSLDEMVSTTQRRKPTIRLTCGSLCRNVARQLHRHSAAQPMHTLHMLSTHVAPPFNLLNQKQFLIPGYHKCTKFCYPDFHLR